MKKINLSALTRSKLTWAFVAEILVLLVCLIVRPDFFEISYQPSTGMLYGNLIDIINRSSEITIIAMGMTLVIALGGTDLSVGALVAVSGAIALKFLRWDVLEYTTPGDYTVYSFALVLGVPLVVCLLMGIFNGFLIAKGGMQGNRADPDQRETVHNRLFPVPRDRAGQLPLSADADYHHGDCRGRGGALCPQNRFRDLRGSRGHQPDRQPSFRHQRENDHPDCICADRLPFRHFRPDLFQPDHVE